MTKIQHKRSTVLASGSAQAPSNSQLDYGELAINYNASDPQLFIKNSSGSVVSLLNEYAKISGTTFTGDVNFDGELTIKGDSTNGSGRLTLNCEQNSHSVKIKGPAHSAAANYTLTLPTSAGSNSQVLTTDGSGNLSWALSSMTVADKSKLDGIESGATADQTGAEIKSLYDAQSNTNAFTDAEKNKLSGIAAGAQVNVATNLSYTASTRLLSSSTGDNVNLPVATTTNAGLLSNTDKSKLNGIESGATADQTAAQILTAIKTVDGSGSGLDADLLDGQQGSYYAPLASPTFTGDLTIPSKIVHAGDTDTYFQFHDSNLARMVVAGAEVMEWGANYVLMSDNDVLRLGTGSDFRMWFDGTDTYFRNYAHTGGDVLFQGEDSAGNNENAMILDFSGDSSYVRLFQASNEKLRTLSGGVGVAGLTVGDVDANPHNAGCLNIINTNNEKIVLSGSTDPYIRFQEGTTDKAYIQWNDGGFLDFRNQENGYFKFQSTVDGQASRLMLIRNDTSTASSNELGSINFGHTDGSPDFPEQTVSQLPARILAEATETTGSGDDGARLRFYVKATNADKATDSVEALRLDQNKNAIFYNDLYVPDQIFHSGDTDCYMQFHAADEWRVVTGGTERLEVNNSAVGVAGVLNVRSALDLADGDVLRMGSSDDFTVTYNSNGWNYINMLESGIIFQDNGTNVMRLEDSGVFRPEATNTRNLGTSSIYWGNAYIQNVYSSNLVNVRNVIDLADNDILRLGSSDDVEFFCNGSHMYTDLNSGIGNWYVRDGTTTRYTFDDNGSFTATGNITAYSDIRLKENIEIISDAVSKVQSLRGITFDRNDNPKIGRQTGVIAQEVLKVLPEAVSSDKNDKDGILTVNYGSMVGLLIEAIKEQQQQINELRENK